VQITEPGDGAGSEFRADELIGQHQSLVEAARCSARCAWYAFQPGHQPVCQRHSRAIKDLGLASAFFRMGQVSQAKVFSDEGVALVFMVSSFHD
jgi:hypothetical protein